MYSSTYLKWFRRLLILGAVVAGFTASAAGARLDRGTPPDVSDVLQAEPEQVETRFAVHVQSSRHLKPPLNRTAVHVR